MATKKITLNELRSLVKQIIKEDMTIDKIKHYMDDYIYKYWTDGVANNGDLSYETKVKLLSNAKKTLESEIEQGILTDIKYQAELKLISSLLR